jgi:hypothetical protein
VVREKAQEVFSDVTAPERPVGVEDDRAALPAFGDERVDQLLHRRGQHSFETSVGVMVCGHREGRAGAWRNHHRRCATATTGWHGVPVARRDWAARWRDV